MLVGVTVSPLVLRAVGVLAGPGVPVGVEVGVHVGVRVLVKVGVSVGVGVMVGVRVGVAEGPVVAVVVGVPHSRRRKVSWRPGVRLAVLQENWV